MKKRKRKSMFSKLLPQSANNNYQGHPIAKWVFIFLTIKAIIAGLIHMFAPDGGAQSIASITLDSFTEGGANTVITIFGLWGLSQLTLALVNAVVIWRYQSLIPLMWLVFLFEYIGRLAAAFYTPGVESINTPPGAILDLFIFPLSLVMFFLSFRSRSEKK